MAEIEKQTQHESELLNKIQKDRSKSESALTGLINENCAFYKLKLARDSDGFFGGKYAENAAALVECEREHKKMLELIKFESRVMFMNKKEIDRVADVCDAEFDRRMKEQTQGINVSK